MISLLSSRTRHLAGRGCVTCGVLVWFAWSLPAAAQYSAGQYQFAPGDHDSNTAWNEPYSQQNTQNHPGPYVSPSGRPYRFREDPEPQVAPQQHRFRPDSKFGRMPRNWGLNREWADDPILREGMVFRPLDDNGAGAEQSNPPPATTPYYGYPAPSPGYLPPPIPWGR